MFRYQKVCPEQENALRSEIMFLHNGHFKKYQILTAFASCDICSSF